LRDRREFRFKIEEIKSTYDLTGRHDYVHTIKGTAIQGKDGEFTIIVDDDRQPSKMFESSDNLLKKLVKKIHEITKER